MKGESVLPLILFGLVALGVVWTFQTGQLGHWIPIGAALYLAVKASQGISRHK